MDKSLLREYFEIKIDEQLSIACKSEDLGTIKYLLRKSGFDVDIINKAFIIADRYGSLNVVEYFLEEHKIDINQQGGRTALVYACANRHLETVKYLMEECNIDITLQDKYRKAAFVNACYYGCLETVKYLVEKCDIDVNSNNKYGLTALMMSSLYNQLDIVKYLVEECKANVEQEAENEETALFIACDAGCLEVVKYLVEEGKADVDIENHFGRTILMNRNLDIIKYLVGEGKVDVNFGTTINTPLIYASTNNHVEEVKYLSKYCDGTMQCSFGGKTALMIACSNGYLEVVKCLLQVTIEE